MLDGVGSAGVVAMGGLGQPDAADDRHDPVVRLGRTLQQGGRGDQERNQHATRGESARSDAWTSGLREAQGRLKPDSVRAPALPDASREGVARTASKDVAALPTNDATARPVSRRSSTYVFMSFDMKSCFEVMFQWCRRTSRSSCPSCFMSFLLHALL